jgi:SAM-dependent methyltransferase
MAKKGIGKIVRDAYGKIAKGKQNCGCPPLGEVSPSALPMAGGTCGSQADTFAKSIGYSEEELKVVPAEANLGLSCGNPTALASIKKGEVVLDLGSGAGFDCFIAASKAGPKGKVIGVDMTPEMIEKARDNAQKNGVKNVEFRLGEIENLPVADESVDVVISNCVINLSADKSRVFLEIYRVLKPGGRIAISDIALKKELPRKVQDNIAAYIGCVAGAILVDDYKKTVESSGLTCVKITPKGNSACIAPDTRDPIARSVLDVLEENESLDNYVVSVYIEGHK